MATTMMFQGYKAEVHTDDRHVSFYGGDTNARSREVVGRLSGKMVAEFLAEAERDGYPKVMIMRSRYISFSLYHIMKKRSGSLVDTTIYTRGENGWVRKDERKNNTY